MEDLLRDGLLEEDDDDVIPAATAFAAAASCCWYCGFITASYDADTRCITTASNQTPYLSLNWGGFHDYQQVMNGDALEVRAVEKASGSRYPSA